MVDQTAVFDIWDLFRNELIGDTVLFILLSALALLYLAKIADLDWRVTTLLMLLWFSILFSQTLIVTIWVFVVFISGLLFYNGISKLFKR